MPDWSLVNRAHVLAAMREYDELGSREYLRRYGFGRATAYSLWHQGREYDPMAIAGVAFLRASGRTPAADDGGKDGAAKVLTDLGFDVVVDEQALAAEAARPTRTRRVKPKPAAVRDTAPKVCPTCFTALPASGVCDYCD